VAGRSECDWCLNRFRKIPGFSEADVEAAAGIKLLWKIPNQYFAISTAIDRGIAGDAAEQYRDGPVIYGTGAAADAQMTPT
jgi:hypothetical protein